MNTLLERLHAFVQALKQYTIDMREKLEPGYMLDERLHLYETAVSFLGRDASPKDVAIDLLGCAESVSAVIQAAFHLLKFPTLTSTKQIYAYFEQSLSFGKIDNPEPYCFILAVTGMGNGTIKNGHVGICGKNTAPDGTLWVMSNDSRTGTWEVTHTVGSWRRYYEQKGGMPTLFYRLV